jgi:hypothetical protein
MLSNLIIAIFLIEIGVYANAIGFDYIGAMSGTLLCRGKLAPNVTIELFDHDV